jgi:hypothetical protein
MEAIFSATREVLDLISESLGRMDGDLPFSQCAVRRRERRFLASALSAPRRARALDARTSMSIFTSLTNVHANHYASTYLSQPLRVWGVTQHDHHAAESRAGT